MLFLTRFRPFQRVVKRVLNVVYYFSGRDTRNLIGEIDLIFI